jgi:GxxExxY protein
MINRIPDLEAEDKFAQRIIGTAMNVHSALGCGFLESIYVNALVIELNEAGLKFEREKRYSVTYKGSEIGFFNADLVIENRLIVEIKAVESLCVAHSIQLVNYLAASKIETGLLLNFGPKRLEFKTKTRTYRPVDPPNLHV